MGRGVCVGGGGCEHVCCECHMHLLLSECDLQ